MSVRGYLGLDIGGTGAKAGVFDDTGRPIGCGHAGFSPTTYPDGRTEIPIEAIYEAARESVRLAASSSGASISAMAVSSQGQTFVSLDENDVPIHPAIMWFDARASKQADWLLDAVRAKTDGEALPIIEAIATAPKILWLREHYPELMAGARRFLLLPDYVSYCLTGMAVTDPSTAASTGLYADDTPGYCRAALEKTGIGIDQLATIQPSGSVIAPVLPNAARDWGIDEGTLLVTGCNDQYAGAIGAGICRPGTASETSGTCLAVTALTERLPEQVPPGIIGGRFPIPEYQFALAYGKTSGLVLDWFRREFCPNRSFRELDEAASRVPPGSRGITVLPHFDGMVSPEPNPGARGAICGLSLGQGIPEIHRAILESLAFNLRENLELMQTIGLKIRAVRCIGGGAKSDLWLQMKADITGLRVERPAVTEAATLGAAILAAVAAGRFSSVEECANAFYRKHDAFEPDMVHHALYEEHFVRYRETWRKLYA